MSAAITATDRARGMILELGGPRTWNDTKESWRARVARTIRLSPAGSAQSSPMNR